MQKFVSNLRQRPEGERKRILFVSLIVAMAVIGGLWVYSLTHRFTPQVAEKTKEDIAPFKLLGSKIKGTYQNMSASVGKAKSIRKDTQKVFEDAVAQENVIDLVPVYK